MATIVIKDLSDSIDLDRKAMTAIIGGTRAGGRPSFPRRTIFRGSSILNYPGGFTFNPLADIVKRSAGNKANK